MMARDDLARRIRLGEDSKLELKRILFSGDKVADPKRKDFADELAAMANGPGGTLALGVDDKSREFLGIPLDRLDSVEGWVREICNDSIKPPVDVDIKKIELPNSDGALVPVVEVVVARSMFVHQSPGGYFRRIGSSKRQLAAEVLARLFQERSQSRVIRFDETPIPGSSQDDLDPDLVTRYLKSGAELTITAARKLRIVVEDQDSVPRLTVSGALLCTREPTTWLPHAYIQAVSYAGTRSDINYQIDARDLRGSLDSQIFGSIGVRETETCSWGRPREPVESNVPSSASAPYSRRSPTRWHIETILWPGHESDSTCSQIVSSSMSPAASQTRLRPTAWICVNTVETN